MGIARFALASIGLLAACRGPAPTPRPTPVDLVIIGGRVFTGDPERPWAEAIAIRGDRIVAVGTTAEIGVAHADARRTIAVDGRLVIPGINDAHVHEPSTWHPAEAAIDGDFGARRDPRCGRRRDQAAPPARGSRQPRLGRGRRFVARPHRARLVAPPSVARERRRSRDRPQQRCAGGVGISETTAPPPAATTVATAAAGSTVASASTAALPRSSAPHGGRRRRYRRRHGGGIDQAAGFGIPAERRRCSTTGGWRGRRAATARPLAAHPLSARWVAIDDVWTPTPGPGSRPRHQGHPRRHADRRGAAMLADGSDRPARWDGSTDTATVQTMMREALRSGDRLHLHVSGDRTLAAVLDAMEAVADDAAWRAHRLVIEHGDALQPSTSPARGTGGGGPEPGALHPAGADEPAIRPADHWFAISRSALPASAGARVRYCPFSTSCSRPPIRPTREALTREQALIAYTQGSALTGLRPTGPAGPGHAADPRSCPRICSPCPTPSCLRSAACSLWSAAIVHPGPHRRCG
jgi:hypothetical protein